MDKPLLEIRDVKKYFYSDGIKVGKKQCVKAVDGFSLDILKGRECWAGWRKWMRKVHLGPHHSESVPGDLRHHSVSGTEY